MLLQKMGARPYDVHAVWTYNGIGGKRARLRCAFVAAAVVARALPERDCCAGHVAFNSVSGTS